MSESDEEGFASADEGEGEKQAADSAAPSDATSQDKKPDTTDVGMVRAHVEEMKIADKPDVPADDSPPAREPTPTRVAKRLSQEVKTPEDGKPTGETPGEKPVVEGEGEHPDDPEKSVLDKLSGAAKSGAGWGWGGISSVGSSMGSWGSNVLSKGSSAINTGLNTATSSVQHFADSVGEGLHVVFDPIEAEAQADEAGVRRKSAKPETPPREPSPTITDQPHPVPTEGPIEGAISGKSSGSSSPCEGPDPPDPPTPDPNEAGWFGGWGGVGILTTAVKKTVKDTTEVFKEQSKTLVSGSKNLAHGTLDVLESIGKKTYDVIAEGDHGLKQTIKKNKEKTNLSQMLREAKERAENDAKEEEEFAETRKAHFGAQFDEFQGLVQLEALEMLSNQCEVRVQTMLNGIKGPQLDSVKKNLVGIKTGFKLEELEDEADDEADHEFDRLLQDYIGQVGLNTTPERLIQVQEKCRKYLMEIQRDMEEENSPDPKEVHEKAIQSLAEFTARCIEHYHRLGQLVLLDKAAPLSSYTTKTNSLASGTRVLCAEVGIFSVKFTQILGDLANKSEDSSKINPMITNVYLEASNSSTYIQDAFLLLLPVVQQGAIEAHQREQSAADAES